MLAERLEGVAKGNELLSRLGGNEFGVVLPVIYSKEEILERIDCIKSELTQKIALGGRELALACSIGIATSQDVEYDLEQMVIAAGFALQHAKEAGKNTIKFYSEQMYQRNTLQFDLKMRMTELIKEGGFELYYQPKVDANDGYITGAEGLIRWPSNDPMAAGPQIFIPLAEKSGQIQAIGQWVLQTGIKQLAKWQSLGLLKDGFRLSLNISAVQLLDETLADTIASLLQEHHVDTCFVEVEITESAVMYEPVKAIKNLSNLHELGVSIAIDDFGTGYSSLSYLTNLPIDVLKIDKSFVDKIGINHNEEMVVNSVIGLSQSLHLKTVAEGVETPSQREFLIKAGCDTIQGYLFSKPLCEKEFTNMMSSQSCFDSNQPYQEHAQAS
jgi:EAL domain-containing protein (putative c-di-GMP-specific phosphodiesterase class I)